MTFEILRFLEIKNAQKDINKKIKAFQEQRSTSHWPHKIKLFPKNPQTYGAPMPNVPPLDPPVLTYLGMKLAGL